MEKLNERMILHLREAGYRGRNAVDLSGAISRTRYFARREDSELQQEEAGWLPLLEFTKQLGTHPSAEDEAFKNMVNETISKVVSEVGLNNNHLKILNMFYVQDKSMPEIAREFGRPVNWIRGRRDEALMRLRGRQSRSVLRLLMEDVLD